MLFQVANLIKKSCVRAAALPSCSMRASQCNTRPYGDIALRQRAKASSVCQRSACLGSRRYHRIPRLLLFFRLWSGPP